MVLAANNMEMLSFCSISEDHMCQREQKIWCIDFPLTFEVRKSPALDMCHWPSYRSSYMNIRTCDTAQLGNLTRARDTFGLVQEERYYVHSYEFNACNERKIRASRVSLRMY
jgi:hypothetical protein